MTGVAVLGPDKALAGGNAYVMCVGNTCYLRIVLDAEPVLMRCVNKPIRFAVLLPDSTKLFSAKGTLKRHDDTRCRIDVKLKGKVDFKSRVAVLIRFEEPCLRQGGKNETDGDEG